MNTIILDGKNLYNEYGLVLNSYSEKMPVPKVNKIEIPGLDGYIDITEAIIGRVVYSEREITAKLTLTGNKKTIEYNLSDFFNEFHGKS